MALAANGRELPEAIAVTHADSPVLTGYLERGVMMKNDANPRGTLDQVGQALRGSFRLTKPSGLKSLPHWPLWLCLGPMPRAG